MLPDQKTQTSSASRIAQKEISLFFASPVAFLFIGTFAAITLFAFFWAEAFFARNIADVRPVFEWMPILLIFLCSALTMRLWSEERRTGTIEHILTQPTPLWQFVLGKGIGCAVLLLIALVVTLPIPLTVSFMAELDWGPVWAGYLAATLLGCTYLSIGLFVSARSDNQIVSLMASVALCGFVYLLGSDLLTGFFGQGMAEWLRLLGTGSRFDSITRGVIDFRDLYYYLSITLFFLVLNTLSLERERWATQQYQKKHQGVNLFAALLTLNILVANLWIGQLPVLRFDATEGKQYSLSEASENYLAQLQEPLLIRGYFSEKTHPLLAPLVPQLRDLIKEYEIAGKGKVNVEIIDPQTDADLEAEANRKYGIQPVPFQLANRYESSIVSSYFNVVVQYGDEHQMLGFRELIEVKSGASTDIDVQLRNPEYDLTNAVKKVMHSYQSAGNLFDNLASDLTFTGYVSPDEKLPEPLLTYRDSIVEILNNVQTQANERFAVKWEIPENSPAVKALIENDYGFKPMRTSILNDNSFYFYLTLASDEQMVQIPVADVEVDTFERDLDAAIKRFATGFTKTVALVTPRPSYGYGGAGSSFNSLKEILSTQYNVDSEDLRDGSVSGDADILVLAAPDNLDEKSLFAVDQFLMKGGTVIASTSSFNPELSGQQLSMKEHESGLGDWLTHYGVSIDKSLVMDPQNAQFPVPVTRNIGGLTIRDVRMLDYPYFVDIRNNGLNQDNPMTSSMPQVTVPWASPVKLADDMSDKLQVTELLHSSEYSWVSESSDVIPRLNPDGTSGFAPSDEQASQLLGVMLQGRFESYFKAKQSPLLPDKSSPDKSLPDKSGESEQDNVPVSDESSESEEQQELVLDSVLEHSADSARLILFSSNAMLEDQVLSMSGVASGSEYVNSLQLLNNAVDWSLEDAELLTIRARGHFNRTLPPMTQSEQFIWETANYLLALLALGGIALWQMRARKARQRNYFELLTH